VAGKQVSTKDLIADPAVQNFKEALKKHLHAKLMLSKEYRVNKSVRPLFHVKEQVAIAWKAKLERKEECAFTCSRFLYSVLNEKNQRFISSVDEANEIWLAGMRFAEYLWGILDNSKGDMQIYDAKVEELASSFRSEFSMLKV